VYGPTHADDISDVFVNTYGKERMMSPTVSSRFKQLRDRKLIQKVLVNGDVLVKDTRWGKPAEVHEVTSLGLALLSKLGTPAFRK